MSVCNHSDLAFQTFTLIMQASLIKKIRLREHTIVDRVKQLKITTEYRHLVQHYFFILYIIHNILHKNKIVGLTVSAAEQYQRMTEDSNPRP